MRWYREADKYELDEGAKIVKLKKLPNGWTVILQDVPGELGYFSIFAQNEDGSKVIEGDMINYPKEAETAEGEFSVKKELDKAKESFDKMVNRIQKIK